LNGLLGFQQGFDLVTLLLRQMGIPLIFGGRVDWLHRSPVLCLFNTYKVTVYLIYGALKSFLCGAAVELST